MRILPTLLTFVSIAILYNRNFAVNAPNAQSLACDSPQIKTRSSHDNFSRNASLGTYVQASFPRMMKGISVPLPSKLGGFGKTSSKSSKKCYKAVPQNVPPSLCLQ
jgi:hypothetical protein